MAILNSSDWSIEVILFMEIKEYKEDEYRILFGVNKITYNKMLEIVTFYYNQKHKKGGRKDGATPQEQLEIYLKYMRQYPSQRYLASEYGIAKSSVHPIIMWVAKVLITEGSFCLPKRTSNITDTSESRAIDATESKIDRPEKHQEDWYSGKKKMHTIKTQIEIGTETLLIYSIDFAKGSTHDFQLFKKSKHDFNSNTTLFVDKGYVGITKIHLNTIIPIKGSRYHQLSKAEKWYNCEISKIRIAIEHVNAFIKKFKIVSTRFRNRRKNFKLFMSLICGIYNFEIANL